MNNKDKEFGYARVSSKGQNLARQVQRFIEYGLNERDIIVDKESGKDFNRTGYTSLKNNILRPGDTLVVCDVYRLGRNKQGIKDELEYFKKNNIRVKILDLPTTLIELPQEQTWLFEMIHNILIEVYGTMAEMERNNTKKWQRQGIDIALKEGRDYGRPKAIKPDNWDEVIAKWQSGEITATKAMELTGTKRTTFYKLLKS